MRFFALATDYDGTLARHGRVDETTLEALERLKRSGRKLILVSGRELPDLQQVFSHLQLFDLAVLENGALLYRPASGETQLLAEGPSREFVEELRRRGVHPISVGRCIVATWEPHQTAVLEAIRECGLELQVIFNKGAVMVLPTGVNKATGLRAALKELRLSPHNVVGVGDAENDHAFMAVCECAAAVANALPALKTHADFTTVASHGQGVIELIDQLLADDLACWETALTRHDLTIGRDDRGREVRIQPYGVNGLIAGSSGGGKSTLVTSIFEQLCARDYQTCIIDPEGDYAEVDTLLLLGDHQRPPSIEEVAKALEDPEENVVVNLVGMRLEDRPEFIQRLLPRLQELRARTGRPHWVLVDEAHHVLPASLDSAPLVVPAALNGFLFVTVTPASVAPAMLENVNFVITIGQSPDETFRSFCRAVGTPPPQLPKGDLASGEALIWRRPAEAPVWLRTLPPRATRRRHIRKYAHGDLAPDLSFYFEGPEGKLRLRAQNLRMFLQLAEGVDDATWMHHLRRGDYSQWFRKFIKDDELANAAERIEQDSEATPGQSRDQIRAEIDTRYTVPV